MHPTADTSDVINLHLAGRRVIGGVRLLMSNASIVARMLETIAAYERGEASAWSVEESVELHGPALEAVPDEARDRLRSLPVQIMMQDIEAEEEALLGITPSRQALQELKSLLGSLV